MEESQTRGNYASPVQRVPSSLLLFPSHQSQRGRAVRLQNSTKAARAPHLLPTSVEAILGRAFKLWRLP